MAFNYKLDGAKTADYIKKHHCDWMTISLKEAKKGKIYEYDFLEMTLLCAEYPDCTVGDCKNYEDFMNKVVNLIDCCDISIEIGKDGWRYICCDNGNTPVVRSTNTGEDWVGHIEVESLADVLDFAQCY